MNSANKKYSIFTLGCKLNFAESSTVTKYFSNESLELVSFSEKADIYVINTCTVTSNAEKKSRNAIRRARKLNPEAIIIVTGCYSQLKYKEIAEKLDVDYVVGVNDKEKIQNILKDFSKKNTPEFFLTESKAMKSFFPAYEKGTRTRAFLKIQDGCDYFCSYCAIPYARGRSRSMSIDDSIDQIYSMATEDLKEIIITGVNIGDFGKNTNENFTELIKKLSLIKEIPRFRLGSIEPDLLTDELIDLIGQSENIMPHFHIPLQSGSNAMLKKMNRRYNSELFQKKIETIKSVLPYAFIGTDIIVGVNGETDEDFNESYEFLKKNLLSSIHVFSYSVRDNTSAKSVKPVVSPAVKRERADAVKQLSEQKQYKFLKDNIGRTLNVLVESKTTGAKMRGYSDNYIDIELDFKKQLLNKIVSVKAIDFCGIDKLKGII